MNIQFYPRGSTIKNIAEIHYAKLPTECKMVNTQKLGFCTRGELGLLNHF